MALTVATNSGALMAQAAASSVNKSMENSMERLATGKRINSASDDAAGVAIASRLTSEIKGTNMAIRNAMDGQAMIDTAEGAHVEVENILQRMRELAVQSANASNNGEDRANLQLEVDQLMTEIDRISKTTTWAGQGLLNGSNGSDGETSTSFADKAKFTFQVGSGDNAADSITTSIGSISSAAIGIGGSLATGGAASDSGPSRISAAADGTITAAGAPRNGDIFEVVIDDVEVKITYSITDTYSNDLAGIGAQLKDKIDALVTAGTIKSPMTVTDNKDGSVKVTTGSTTPTLDTISEDAASGTVTLSNNSITFAGTWVATKTSKVNVNGITVTATATALDGFSLSKLGQAANMKSAIENQAGLEHVSVTDNGDGSITITQGLVPTIEGPEVVLKNAAESTLAYDDTNKLVVGGSFVDGKNYSFNLMGKSISVTASATDGFSNDKAGVASQIAQAINDAGIHGISAAKTANENAVTLTGKVTAGKGVVNNGSDFIITSVGSQASATINISSNASTVAAAAYANGDSYTFEVADEEFTLVIGADGFSNTKDGVTTQMMDLIKSRDLAGITVAANKATSAGVTITNVLTGTTSGSTNSTVVTDVVVMDGVKDVAGANQAKIDISSNTGAVDALKRLDDALSTLSSQRAELGATSNRLDSTISNLTNISSNLTAGRGRIEDADFAAETTNLAKTQILQQASTAMLAQANASKQGVLSLLQG